MLVQFSMRNVLSFKDEVVLDMTAIPSYKEHEDNLIDLGLKDKYLRVAAIYGANASGKSNLVAAMRYFQDIILSSNNRIKDGEAGVLEQLYRPYSFTDKRETSEYQIVVADNEFEYRYGFEFDDEEIVTEWLYRVKLSTMRQSVILERSRLGIEFGASVRRELNKFKDKISKETLVLSFFSNMENMKVDDFNRVYDLIVDTLVVSSEFAENNNVIYNLLPRVIDEEKAKLVSFLNAIDVGIIDIDYDDTEKEIKFTTYHIGQDGKEHSLSLFRESEGTIKSIVLYIYARFAVMTNRSMFVDELNSKLHPLLLKFIIDLFYEQNSRAQLLYTTHDTTLMDKKFFRRDQIWFVQKNDYGCSELASLSDFKVRSDASFEKDYLAGVYGGIPQLKELGLIKDGE